MELDLRNMIVVGTSLLVGLGVEIRPEVIGQLPENVQVIFGSALAAGTATALVLNISLEIRTLQRRLDASRSL